MDVVGAVKGRNIFVTGGIGFIGEGPPIPLLPLCAPNDRRGSPLGVLSDACEITSNPRHMHQ